MAILSDYYKEPLPQNDGVSETKAENPPIEWDVVFDPTVGRCYELFFSRKGTEGTDLQNSARVRVNGKERREWIDFSTQRPLASYFVVQGSREISSPDDGELDPNIP